MIRANSNTVIPAARAFETKLVSPRASAIRKADQKGADERLVVVFLLAVEAVAADDASFLSISAGAYGERAPVLRAATIGSVFLPAELGRQRHQEPAFDGRPPALVSTPGGTQNQLEPSLRTGHFAHEQLAATSGWMEAAEDEAEECTEQRAPPRVAIVPSLGAGTRVRHMDAY